MSNSDRCKKVSLAITFLGDSRTKSHHEDVIREYLIERRKLTDEEVDIAFLFHKNRTEIAEKQKQEHMTKGDREHHETRFPERKHWQDVSFLIPSKQAAGTKLISEFLDQERAYCNILEILKNDYYVQLIRYADQEKLQMGRREIEEIFHHIPHLLKFHWKIFCDIRRGYNIGRLFVRLFRFFEDYAKYMKNCQQTVLKMRLYIKDVQLTKCLDLISNRSIVSNDGLVDLLLIPLDRILKHRVFLSNLMNWADKSQTINFELEKAERRIGRVSAYIEKYKNVIVNQNEMNKVQRFLGNQYDILTPDRFIIRRGMMIRRATSWTGWNKRFIFFLFNDMLLWTNKNGNFCNALQLRNSEVMPSCAKHYANRKFDLVYRGKKHKILRLECDTENLRNGWYEACKSTITAAKVTCAQTWMRSKFSANRKEKEYSDNLNDTVSTEEYEDSSRVDLTEQLDDPRNERYTLTYSYKTQEFKEIDPMEDNLSQISEWDVAYHLENSLPSTCQSNSLEAIGENDTRRIDDHMSIIQRSDRVTNNDFGTMASTQDRALLDQSKEIKTETELTGKTKKSCIIRDSNSERTTRSKTSPQLKIRLDDL